MKSLTEKEIQQEDVLIKLRKDKKKILKLNVVFTLGVIILLVTLFLPYTSYSSYPGGGYDPIFISYPGFFVLVGVLTVSSMVSICVIYYFL